jgi:archaellum component FlaC
MASSLGEELSAALSNITALVIKTENKNERTQLTRQQAQIAGQLQVFVDQVVDEALPEYEEATDALNAANTEAEAAKKKLDKVASSIKKFATAIDKLESLAEKVT